MSDTKRIVRIEYVVDDSKIDEVINFISDVFGNVVDSNENLVEDFSIMDYEITIHDKH